MKNHLPQAPHPPQAPPTSQSFSPHHRFVGRVPPVEKAGRINAIATILPLPLLASYHDLKVVAMNCCFEVRRRGIAVLALNLPCIFTFLSYIIIKRYFSVLGKEPKMIKKLLIALFILFGGIPSFARTIEIDPDSIPFSPAVSYEVGTNPYSVFCADLNGDSALDLAVVHGCGS